MKHFYYGCVQGEMLSNNHPIDEVNSLVNIQETYEKIWLGCLCFVEENIDHCQSCYSSRKRHINSLCPTDITMFNENKSLITFSEDEFYFHLTKKEHLFDLEMNLKNLELFVDPIVIKRIDKLKKNNIDLRSNYDNWWDSIYAYVRHNENVELVVKYLFGIQIEYVLLRQDECKIYFEI